METLHTLVCSGRSHKTEQLEKESELEQLKIKMHLLENDITDKKKIIAKLFPTISELHRSVIKNRQIHNQLNKYCQQVGKLVAGTDYM